MMGPDAAEAVVDVIERDLKDRGQRILIPATNMTQVAGTASTGADGIAKRKQIGEFCYAHPIA